MTASMSLFGSTFVIIACCDELCSQNLDTNYQLVCVIPQSLGVYLVFSISFGFSEV